MALLRIPSSNATISTQPFDLPQITGGQRVVLLALVSAYGQSPNGWMFEDANGQIIPPDTVDTLDEIITELIGLLSV